MRLVLVGGEKIETESAPFGQGGEANLYRVVAPLRFKSRVVKIYHADKRDARRRAKIEYMSARPPETPGADGTQTIIWPETLVFNGSVFVGYMAPLALGAKLEYLCLPRLPQTPEFQSSHWKRFVREAPGALEKRLALCFNVAAALEQIHRAGDYVLVDLKPDNILVRPEEGRVALLDLDSIALRTETGEIFAAPVITPEYAPSENAVRAPNDFHQKNWDYFALAVIFYRLLTGIHPFTGACGPPFDKLSGHADLIRQGLFPHSPSRGRFFRVVPPPHQTFLQLPPAVQSLFIRCFEEGHDAPDRRPAPVDWLRVLQTVLSGETLSFSYQTAPLPSRLYPFPFYDSPLAPPFPLPPPAPPQTINFINLAENERYFDAFISFLGLNKRQRLRETLKEQQEKVKRLSERLARMDIIYLELKEKYLYAQQQERKREKIETEALERFYKDEIKELDARLENLFSQRNDAEAKAQETELKALETRLAALTARYENQKRAVEKELAALNQTLLEKYRRDAAPWQNRIDEREAYYRLEETNLYQELVAREQTGKEKIRKEITDEMQDVERRRLALTALSAAVRRLYVDSEMKKYKIKEHIDLIFNDKYSSAHLKAAIAANLARKKIITAADFDSCEANGALSLGEARGVKVEDVGPVRARALVQWRDRLHVEIIHRLPPFEPDMNLSDEAAVLRALELEKLANQTRQKEDRLQETFRWFIDSLRKESQTKTTVLQEKRARELEPLRFEAKRLEKAFLEMQAGYERQAQEKTAALTAAYQDESAALIAQKNEIEKRRFARLSETKTLFAAEQQKLADEARRLQAHTRERLQTLQEETRRRLNACVADFVLLLADYQKQRIELGSMVELEIEIMKGMQNEYYTR